MCKLLLKIGKELGSDKWEVIFSNQTQSLSFHCEDPFEFTFPFAGKFLDKIEVMEAIIFLQKTLSETENVKNHLE